MCCTGVCHVAARSKVVVRTQDKRRSPRVVSVRGINNKSSLEERWVRVGSCGINALVRLNEVPSFTDFKQREAVLNSVFSEQVANEDNVADLCRCTTISVTNYATEHAEVDLRFVHWCQSAASCSILEPIMEHVIMFATSDINDGLTTAECD